MHKKRKRKHKKVQQVFPTSCWPTECITYMHRRSHTHTENTHCVCVWLVCVCTSSSPSWSPPSSMCSSSEWPDLAAVALGAACQSLPPRQCHVTPMHKAAGPTHFLQITLPASLPPSETIHRRRHKTVGRKQRLRRQQSGCDTAEKL